MSQGDRNALFTAALLPALELLCFVLAAYTFTASLAVDYLLVDDERHGRRVGAAVAILVIFWILWFFPVSALIRNIISLIVNPPHVLSSTGPVQEKAGPDHQGHINRESLESTGSQRLPAFSWEQPSTQNPLRTFWNPRSRVAYLAQGDGLPPRCNQCGVWKPDRAHHSSAVGRCVTRMDHFCPWFGGIIGDTNHKFFVQFCASTALFCLFGIITLAYFVNERRVDGDTSNPNFILWCVTLGLMAFFFNFTSPMTYFNMTHVFKNLTQIEEKYLQRNVYTVAVNVGYFDGKASATTQPARRPWPMIYHHGDGHQYVPANSDATSPIPDDAVGFAIIQARARENLFDHGSAYANFTAMMGHNIFDWILPIRSSPPALNDFGPQLEEMTRRGISPPGGASSTSSPRLS